MNPRERGMARNHLRWRRIEIFCLVQFVEPGTSRIIISFDAKCRAFGGRTIQEWQGCRQGDEQRLDLRGKCSNGSVA